MVHVGNGVPETAALKVVSDSVSGAVQVNRTTEPARRIGGNSEAGVGDPRVAPGFENGESN